MQTTIAEIRAARSKISEIFHRIVHSENRRDYISSYFSEGLGARRKYFKGEGEKLGRARTKRPRMNASYFEFLFVIPQEIQKLFYIFDHINLFS